MFNDAADDALFVILWIIKDLGNKLMTLISQS